MTRLYYVIACLSWLSAAALAENLPASTVEIPLNPPIELDYKSKHEVYEIRKSYVAKYPNLITGLYTPQESIFGQITDGRPWWGLMGLSYFGHGERSIDGLSDESRFIANPLLLVGLDLGHAMILQNTTFKPSIIYPTPSHLFWRTDKKEAGVGYDISGLWKALQAVRAKPTNPLTLIAYNARDLGWNYLYVDPATSKNVTGAAQVAQINQFIHTGGSCGFKGGCNNMSPYQSELVITINALPAVASIKLWKEAPKSAEQQADMIFVIGMK